MTVADIEMDKARRLIKTGINSKQDYEALDRIHDWLRRNIEGWLPQDIEQAWDRAKETYDPYPARGLMLPAAPLRV